MEKIIVFQMAQSFTPHLFHLGDNTSHRPTDVVLNTYVDVEYICAQEEEILTKVPAEPGELGVTETFCLLSRLFPFRFSFVITQREQET